MAEFKTRCVFNAKAELGECPLWSAEENCLYWIDIDGKNINRLEIASGKNKSWALPAEPGSFVLKEGGGALIAMREGLFDFDFNGSLEKRVAAPYDTAKIRFNDGRTDRQGRYWVGSMPASLTEHDPSLEGTYYSYDGEDLKAAPIAGVHHANGTVFSVDGKTMYRGETLARKIYNYDLNPATGEISNERVFATVPDDLGMPDGATLDTEGGYWAALPAGPKGGSIARFTPDGKLDVVIDLPVAICTMPAFGGPNLSTIYVTTGRLEAMIGKQVTEISGGIFAIETPFRGLPEVKFKSV